MYTLHSQNKKKLDVRQAPRYVKGACYSQNKKVNFLNKKTKSYNGLNIDKRKKNIRYLKTNNLAPQIICLFLISRYNFHYLKSLFIKSFIKEINCNIKNVGVTTLTK